jgi:hypothetical protein
MIVNSDYRFRLSIFGGERSPFCTLWLMSRKNALILLLVITASVIVAAFLAPRVAQPQSYHRFADQRSWLGIPRFGDVASNLPFAIVGLWGLIFLLTLTPQRLRECFIDPRERWPYYFVFLGLLLTALGSSYYHLAPENTRLVWDRLPMTVVFMALVAAMVAERIAVPAGLSLLPVLLAIGIASVIQWHLSEVRGAGDLRFYAAVQVYAGLVLLLILLFPARYTRGSDLAVVVGFYVLAKILETFDSAIFNLDHDVSGHTLKHLAGAAAGYWILRMLQKRKPLLSR